MPKVAVAPDPAQQGFIPISTGVTRHNSLVRST